MIGPILLILVGLALAFAGRQLIWLLIGAAGFILGYQLTVWLMPGTTDLVVVLIAVVVGLIGGYFATKFTSLLINIAAFILVGNAGLAIAALFGIEGVLLSLIFFVIGGVVGLALVRFALNWALIIISAWGGASMVMQGTQGLLDQPERGTIVALIGLAVLIGGLLVQYRGMKTSDA